jgi:hypothetical protein
MTLGETPQALERRGGSLPAPRKASAFHGKQHHCLTETIVQNFCTMEYENKP